MTENTQTSTTSTSTSTVRHPAKFAATVLERLRVDVHRLHLQGIVIDPFAGVGGVHDLATPQLQTVGVEIEKEWAEQHPQTIVGDALKLPFGDDTFQGAVTSCCYGNRLSDHHEARDGSKRYSYRHTLGRPLSPQNAGSVQWGWEYRHFHFAAWMELQRVLQPGGTFFLNISNHIRGGVEQPVVEWHLRTLIDLGFLIRRVELVRTPRLRFGANRNARVGFEQIITAFKP